MLETCFIHLSGVGPGFVDKLHGAGIFTWDDALCKALPCGAKRAKDFLKGVAVSKEKLADGDIRWFGEVLPPSEQWRLYPYYRDNAAYVDIETTGLSWSEDCITTIALYDGRRVRTYTQGRNLEAFADDILGYGLLVTWNGRGFDAPLLRRSLNIPLDKGGMPHLDLLPVFRKLDLRGGLKKVEKTLGIDRDELDGVDGWLAVRLWNAFERTRDERYLETLLAYNVADVLSLEYLAAYAVMRHTGLSLESQGVSGVRANLNPFMADIGILRKMGY